MTEWTAERLDALPDALPEETTMTTPDDAWAAGYKAARRFYSDQPRAQLAAIRREANALRQQFADYRIPAPFRDFLDRIDQRTQEEAR